MLATQITETSLRAAVVTGIKNNTGDIAKSIQDAAYSRAQTLLQANSKGSSLSEQSSAQLTLITAAVATIAMTYKVVTEHVKEKKEKRLLFDKERIAGIATFCLPKNVETAHFSKEQKLMSSFLKYINDLSQKNSSERYIHAYLGIQAAQLSSNSDFEYYSVMPFYRMSQNISQPLSSQKPIDIERTAIGLFFKARLARIFKDIDDNFQTQWSFVETVASAYQGENYLNDLRAPRFIIMCLGNLLWNLQHPVDLNTGFPLSTADTLDVCKSAELYLSTLLNIDQPPFIKGIDNEINCLISVIRQIEIKVKALKAAYVFEQIHELNIADINHTGHHTLRLMDTSLLKLIYKNKNPTTGKEEPDVLAADTIANTVSYLNQLLYRNKDRSILELFDRYRHLVKSPTGFNQIPVIVDGTEIRTHTVMDIIIIFCHMRTVDRKELIDALNQKKDDPSDEFAKTISDFYKHYIKRIKRFTEIEIGIGWIDKKENEVVDMTARRLIPLIALVLADYRVNVNIDWPNPINPNILEGTQQIQEINAEANEKGKYYHWSLSPLLSIEGESAEKFDQFPIQQYRMTQMTQIMDQVMGLISEYRNLLQSHDFQKFLLHFMNKIKSEYEETGKKVEKLDEALSKDETICRSLNGILRTLLEALERSIHGFTKSVSHFEKIISAPDFLKKQRRLLNQKLENILSQYEKIFNKDPEGAQLISKLIHFQHESPSSFLPCLEWVSRDTSVESTGRAKSQIPPPPRVKTPPMSARNQFESHPSPLVPSSRPSFIKPKTGEQALSADDKQLKSDSFLLMLLRHPIIKVVSAVLFIAGVVAMTMGYLGLLGLGMFAMKAGAVATTSGTVGYSPSFWKSSESKNKTPVPSADFDTEMPGLIYNK